jgi:hypothetical protein
VTTPDDIAARLAEVNGRIRAAAARAGRDPPAVQLIAVSKAKPSELIRAAFAAGQRDFGENYVQELQSKRPALSDLEGIRWHFIGGLQRNKARQVVDVALVHSVDRAELALELDRRARAIGAAVEVLIEVNVGGEDQKSGCSAEELPALLASVSDAQGLSVQGLMTVPPLDADADRTRPMFASLRALRDRHRAALGRGELSMGMSHDFEEAIEEGATLVRVGTAIFGAR